MNTTKKLQETIAQRDRKIRQLELQILRIGLGQLVLNQGERAELEMLRRRDCEGQDYEELDGVAS
jgi:hypothetical protein